MATTNENIRRENPALTGVASLYSWTTMQMLSKGAAEGYYLPGLDYVGSGLNWASKKFLGVNPNISTRWRFGAVPSRLRGSLSKVNPLNAGRLMARTKSPVTRLAMAKVATSKIAGLVLKGIVLELGILAGQVGWAMWDNYASQAVQNRRAFSGRFMESREGYTSRQRTLRAITSSRLQARSAVGNEAYLLHR
jgi:hypothetical protein